jgi:hypothetical protein
MLIAGGVIIAISFAVTASLVVPDTEEYTIAPGESQEIRRQIMTGQGSYTIILPDAGSKASVKVRSPANETLVDYTAESPLAAGPVEARTPGNYTLVVTNSYSDSALTVQVLFAEQQPEIVAAGLLLYVGIIIIIAGVAVTILDGRREKKMRQFGDMSDLR